MDTSCDLLIVGAGPVGCVIAERAARLRGWRSLIIERRPHLAGNCYDAPFENGVLIHKYGPHYFRTNDPDLFEYLSGFTDWITGNYIVQAHYKGQLYPIPINLITLRKFFGREFTAETAEAELNRIRIPIANPTNSEDFVLGRIGKELYEAFYLGYTLKQWDCHPRNLDASVCGRIPLRFNEDCRYVNHSYQVMPAKGFTELFRRMVDHPNIRIAFQTNYREVRHIIYPRIATVYCGPIDEYFDFKLGKLPWRSLDFEFKKMKKKFHQPCVQINYPWDNKFTRSVEIKHVTGQEHAETVVSYEYSRSEGDPYYPVPSEQGKSLYAQYRELADKERQQHSVYFAGRLATFRYMNTDEAIASALETFQIIKDDAAGGAEKSCRKSSEDQGKIPFSF